MGYPLKLFRLGVMILLATAFGVSSLALGHSMSGMHTAGAGVNSLDVYADGGVIHLLIGRDEPDHPTRLLYLRSDDGGAHWSSPVEVNPGGPAVYARRGMDPQIAAAGKHLIAVWTTRNDNRYGRGPMATAISSDGGKTWRPGPNPADDHSTADHGMIDLAADASGVFHLAWLDARNGQKGLIYARSADDGKSWSANRTLCAETCECCWNTIATAPGGTVAVLYRQLEAGRCRDMGLMRSGDRGKSWDKPVTVGRFNWEINACAHCGGGLVFSHVNGQTQCHAAVWTGNSPPGPGVFVLNSPDGGRKWDPPSRLGDDSAFHPDLAGNATGRLVAAWEASRDNHSVIFAARSIDHGKTWSRPILLSNPAAQATHPRVVWTPKGFRVFWTQHLPHQAGTWQMEAIAKAK